VAVVVVGVIGIFAWQQQQQQCVKAADPTRSGAVTEYCPSEPYQPFNGAMAVGPDGNLWYTSGNRQVTRFTLSSGAMTAFDAPSAPNDIAYQGMVRGTDGNLWYVANYTLGRISMNGAVKEFALPKDMGLVAAIAVGSDGTLWVTMGNVTLLKGSIPSDSTQAPTLTRVPLPAQINTMQGPFMAAGADGNLWMATAANTFLRITPAGSITQFPLNGPRATTLTAGPDGNIWFIGESGKIGRITPTGATTYFSVSDIGMQSSMGAGPDGNVWFTTTNGNIARITPAGVITKFSLPHTGGQIGNITAGPDGGVWFIFYSSYSYQPSSRLVHVTP